MGKRHNLFWSRTQETGYAPMRSHHTDATTSTRRSLVPSPSSLAELRRSTSARYDTVVRPDEEQPRIDDAAEETRPGSGDEQVQATSSLAEEGKPRNADEHGRGRVRGEPCKVAEDAPIGTATGPPVHDGQGCTRDRGRGEELPNPGLRVVEERPETWR